MAKKKTEPVEELKSSAQRIWLAGLGALAEAEKHGDKLFRSLVKQGRSYDDLLSGAGAAVTESVGTARKQASQALRDVESAFDRQVKKAMERMGVATQAEVDALRREVSRLKAASGSTSSRRRKTTKAAKKTTARRKAAARKAKKTTRAKKTAAGKSSRKTAKKTRKKATG